MTPKGQKQKRHPNPGIHKMIENGKTVYRATVDIGEGIDRVQRSQRFRTLAEAKDWRTEMQARHRRGEVVEPSRQLLRAWFAEWIATRATMVRPSTVGNYRRNFALLDPLIGAVSLAKLTPSQIERVYAELGRQYAPVTIRGAHRVLSAMLRTAVRDRLIQHSPLEHVTPPSEGDTPRAAWTPHQAGVFLAGVRGHPHEDAWHVFLECWLRSGELRALRWSDIDLVAGTLTVAQSVTGDEQGRPGIGLPKNASSRRTMDISPELAARLQDRLHGQRLTALLSGEAWSDDRLVFPSRAGGLMTSGTLCDALRRICDRLGLPYYGVHGLRHTGPSLAYTKRVPDKVISERLGHRGTATAQRIYLHTDPAQRRELAHLMGDLLAKCSESDRDPGD